MKCPNKNLKEWQDLVNVIGESNAYYAYYNNNEEIPSISEARFIIQNLQYPEDKSIILTREIPSSNPLNTTEGFALAKTIIPDLSKSEIQFIPALFQGGEFKDGILKFYTVDNNIDAKIIKHEVFHKVWEQYIPENRKKEIFSFLPTFQVYLDWSGGAVNPVLMEEFLAEKFQDYISKQGKQYKTLESIFKFIKDIFDKIKSLFKKVNGKQLDRLFNEIYKGDFSKRILSNAEVNKQMFIKQVQILFPANSRNESIVNYIKAKNFLKGKMAELQEQGYSLGEIKKIMESKLKEVVLKELNPKGREEAIKILQLPTKEVIYNYDFSEDFKSAYYLIANKGLGLNHIISDMFASYNSKTHEELMELEDEALKGDALYSEMIDNVKTDYENKLTQVLKEHFNLVQRPDGIFLDPRFVYAKTLEYIGKVDLNDESQTLKTLDVLRSKETNINALAVLNNLISTIVTTTDYVNIPRVDVIYNPTQQKFIFTVDGKQLNLYSRDEQFKAVKELLSKDKITVTDEELITLLNKRRVEVIYTTMYSEMASLEDAKPEVQMVYTKEEKEFGETFRINRTTEFRSNPVSPAQLSNAIKENLESKFQELYDENRLKDYDFRTISNEGLVMLLGIELENYSAIDLDKLKDITGQAFSELARKGTTDNIQGYLQELGDIISKNHESVAAQSYFDGKKNRRYKWIMGSWAYDAIKKVMKGQFSGIYQDFSMFKNKLNTIHRWVNFDSIKNNKNGKDTSVVQYQNFDANDYATSHFFVNFIGIVHRSTGKKKKPTYFQPTYTQSNRADDMFVELNINTNTELEKIADLNRQQELERADIIKEVTRLQNLGFGNKSKAEIDKMTEAEKEYYKNLSWDLMSDSEKEYYKKYGKKNYNKNKDLLYETDNETLWKRLEQEANEDFIRLLDNQGEFTYNNNNRQQIENVYEILKDYPVGQYPEKEVSEILSKKKYPDQEIEITKKLHHIFQVYYKHNYILGHQVNLAIFGDIGLTKDNTDLIKRMQGIKSPGKKQLTNRLGNTPTSNVVTVKDAVYLKEEMDDLKGIYSKILGADINSTDAVTLATPSAIAGIRKGTGDNTLGAIIKTITFFIDENGVTHYNKTAVFELTDDLVNKFPRLKAIREDMEANDVSYFTFESAYKVGQPLDLLTLGNKIEPKHITQWDNNFVRVQGNPRHIDSEVSDPSQMNYFLNQPVNESGKTLNEAEAFEIYKLEEELTDVAWKRYNLENKIVDNAGNVNQENLKKAYLKTLTDRDFDNVYDGLDFNYPSIANSLIIQLSNIISKNSIQIKHSGNKLINQSSLGVRLYDNGFYNNLTGDEKLRADNFEALPYNIQEALINYTEIGDARYKKYEEIFSKRHFKTSTDKALFEDILDSIEDYLMPRKLQMRNENNYTEVIAPAWWKDKGIELGDVAVYNDLYKEGFAVRIPTTGVHSGLAIKIVGFNPDINGIIVPEEVVAIHGSDFDVDALYFMHREVNDLKDKQGNYINFKFLLNNKKEIEYKQGDLIGYTKEGNWDSEFERELQATITNLESVEGIDEKRLSELYKIQEKLLKNKKFDLYNKILTKPENQEDMNTPISFDSIKADIEMLKEGKLSDYIINSILEQLNTNVESLTNEWNNNPALQETITLDKYIADNKPDKVYTIQDVLNAIEIKDNKLTVQESVKQALLKSKLGVKGKMQILKGTTKLDKRNPDRFYHQLLMHKDNFEGATGTGIEANIMKTISYLMQGSQLYLDGEKINIDDIASIENDKVTLKDGRTGILTRDEVKTGNSYTINGVEYNSFRRIASDGTKTTETSDTVLNGYIDNVKEQITTIINANKITINYIGYMIYLGMPIDTITYIMNQPSIIELSKSTKGYQRRLKQAIKNLEAQGHSEAPISNEALQDVIEKGTNNPALQLSVLKMFESMQEEVEQLTQLSGALNILKKLPVEVDEMDKSLKDLQQKLKFTSPDFLNIQSIKAALGKLKLLRSIIDETFLLYGKKGRQLINKIIKDTGYESNSRDKSAEKEIRKEYEKFLLNAWVANLKSQGKLNTPYKGLNKDKKLETDSTKLSLPLSVEEAWVQSFIQEVKDYKIKDSYNPFVQYFSIKTNKQGVSSLKFNGGTSLKDDRILHIMSGFLTLPAELREKFVIYSVMKDGGAFGFKGFTSILGVKNTSSGIIDGIEDVANYYKETLQRFVADDTLINNTYEYFLLQFLKNNSEKIYVLEDIITGEEKDSVLSTYGIDNSEQRYVVTNKETPKYVIGNKDMGQDIYQKVDIDSKDYSVYKKIIDSGDLKFDGTYHYNPRYEYNKFELDSQVSQWIAKELAKNNVYSRTYQSSTVKPSNIDMQTTIRGELKMVNRKREVSESTVTETYTVIDNETLDAQKEHCNLK
jgi:hypothetical protein